VTNSPVFPGRVLFSSPVMAVLADFYKVMKMSWFSKNSSAKYRWANKEDEEKTG